MDAIQQKLNENLEKLTADLLSTHVRHNHLPFVSIFMNGSRNSTDVSLRTVLRSVSHDLVINRLCLASIDIDNTDSLLQLDHENIEKVLYNGKTENFFIWITPLFVTKLKTVWVKMEQFRVHDVKKIFLDLLNGLEYLKSKNVSSGVIHEDNLAYNGKSWYISGIINAEKEGENTSGVYIQSSLKSRRYEWFKKNHKDETPIKYIPEDDLWQLVLMYVITYYGFNPFQDQNAVFFAKTGTLRVRSSHILRQRILSGKCQNITLTTRANHFGVILKNLLTFVSLNTISYELFRYVIENNGTSYT
jgi:hypothetical protein